MNSLLRNFVAGSILIILGTSWLLLYFCRISSTFSWFGFLKNFASGPPLQYSIETSKNFLRLRHFEWGLQNQWLFPRLLPLFGGFRIWLSPSNSLCFLPAFLHSVERFVQCLPLLGGGSGAIRRLRP